MRTDHRQNPPDPAPRWPQPGYPLLGDGKYGKLDKQYDRKIQALYSYKLTFCFTTDSGSLAYLNGKTFQVADVSFVSEYFT